MSQKTSITQIEVANEKITREVAMLMKLPEKEVIKFAKFIGRYIAATMERGQMEAVMLPYFGKFKPKDNYRVQELILARERSGMDMVYRAIKGKKVVDLRNKKSYDKDRPIKSPKRI